MDRKNFLAFIPAISAIPLIGKDIVQKPDKIEIYQPEELQRYESANFGGFDLSKCRLQIVQDGKVLASGWLNEMTIEAPSDIEVRSEDGYTQGLSGLQKCEVRGIITDFKSWNL